MNDLEARLAEAFSARADSVQSEDLSDRPLPASIVPLWRRTPVLMAAAACLTVVATSAVVLAGLPQGHEGPRPAGPTPQVVLPTDEGVDWPRAKASARPRLDLDGDGTVETVQLLAEPSEDFDGRVRLQTTLSGSGDRAFGVIDIGTSIGVDALAPIDADRDGDQELVIYHEATDDVMDQLVVVLDLRDGLLVEAPQSSPGLLMRGTAPVPDDAPVGDYYQLVQLRDYWIEDGRLFSSSSQNAFAEYMGGMNVARPERLVVSLVEWVLRDDGVLEPMPADEPCRVVELGGPAKGSACEPGERDAPPRVAPVADEVVRVGGTFSSRVGYRYDVRVEAGGGDPTLVVANEDGRRVEQPLDLGPDPVVFTQQPLGVLSDGASVVAAADDAVSSRMTVFGQDRDRMVPYEVVGDIELGSGVTAGGAGLRTWLTTGGSLVTAVHTGDGDAWDVFTWTGFRGHKMGAIPRGTVCFDDIADPDTARTC